MQELQASKEYQDLQKKYKDEQAKTTTEQAKLLQEKGTNPVGSCLPTLLQLPIIFGLYRSIARTLAATPLQMLQLAKNVYPFTPALCPDSHQKPFPVDGTGRARAADVVWRGHPGIDHPGSDHHVHAVAGYGSPLGSCH